MKLLALALLLMLNGCASLYWAGVSEYKVSPLLDANNKVIGCCLLTVISGKEYQSVVAKFTKIGDDYWITVNEKQVAAFKGQAIAADAASDVAAAAAGAAVDAAKFIK